MTTTGGQPVALRHALHPKSPNRPFPQTPTPLTGTKQVDGTASFREKTVTRSTFAELMLNNFLLLYSANRIEYLEIRYML